MTAMTVLFSHGLESGPWGTKIRSMAELARGRGATVDSIDYQGMRDPDARVRRLIEAAGGLDSSPSITAFATRGPAAPACTSSTATTA